MGPGGFWWVDLVIDGAVGPPRWSLTRIDGLTGTLRPKPHPQLFIPLPVHHTPYQTKKRTNEVVQEDDHRQGEEDGGQVAHEAERPHGLPAVGPVGDRVRAPRPVHKVRAWVGGWLGGCGVVLSNQRGESGPAVRQSTARPPPNEPAAARGRGGRCSRCIIFGACHHHALPFKHFYLITHTHTKDHKPSNQI